MRLLLRLQITEESMQVEPQMFFQTNAPIKPIGITLTESARQYVVLKLDDRRNDDHPSIGIRFGVTGAGCGGYSYVVEFVDVDGGEDHVFEQDHIKIFVDKKSILLIDGMEVDYINEGFTSGLEFNNPLAGQTCGCGESFSV